MRSQRGRQVRAQPGLCGLGGGADCGNVPFRARMPPWCEKLQRDDHIAAIERRLAEGLFKQRLVEGVLRPFSSLHRRSCEHADCVSQFMSQLSAQMLANRGHGRLWAPVVDQNHWPTPHPGNPLPDANFFGQGLRDPGIRRLVEAHQGIRQMKNGLRMPDAQRGQSRGHVVGQRGAGPEKER